MLSWHGYQACTESMTLDHGHPTLGDSSHACSASNMLRSQAENVDLVPNALQCAYLYLRRCCKHASQIEPIRCFKTLLCLLGWPIGSTL